MRAGLIAMVLTTLPVTLAAQSEVVSDSAAIAQGKRLYETRGLCASCHGMKGEGLLGVTTRLDSTKQEWLHHDGSLDGIVAVVIKGVMGDDSISGAEMPPRGGSRLTDEQIRLVAHYVRELHKGKAPK